MLRFNRRLGFGLAAFLAVASAHAGSYLQSGGDINYSVGAGYFFATDEWDGNRDLVDLPCRNEYLFNSHFLEYGWSYYYTLFGGLNLARSKCGVDSTTGVGDIRLGLRGRLNRILNNRAWQLELNVPTSRDSTGQTRLGCGAYGLAGSLSVKDKVTQSVRMGAEGGVQLWEAPLSHVFEGRVSADGPIINPFSWNANLAANAPLNSRGDPGVVISDCGTQGRTLSGAISLGYRVRSGVYMQCGTSADLWGEDTTRRLGFFCGYSHRFKD